MPSRFNIPSSDAEPYRKNGSDCCTKGVANAEHDDDDDNDEEDAAEEEREPAVIREPDRGRRSSDLIRRGRELPRKQRRYEDQAQDNI